MRKFNKKNCVLCTLRRNAYLWGAALLGLSVFLLVFGVEPLRVTGTAWIYKGYGGDDILQHQTGWMFFRSSPWHFPLGQAADLGTPEGVSISFTDSIPLLSIIFKLLSPLLPEHFQFFGIYSAFCLMSQGMLAAFLIHHFTGDKGFSMAGSLLFCGASSLLDRMFRHTALASHGLILAAMVLYFCCEPGRRRTILSSLLLCIALGTHPYLFVMTGAILVFAELRCIRETRNIGLPLLRVLLYAGISLGFGYILGVFSGDTLQSAGGYGVYSLNLNALMNPLSRNGSRWSLLLPELPLYSEQKDGSYYFGLPALLALLAVLFAERKILPRLCKKHREYLLLMLLLTLFAVGPSPTWGTTTLFKIPLPEKIQELCGTFRAGARFFFVPYYSLYLLLLWGFRRFFQSKRGAEIAVMLLVLLQFLEISPAIQNTRNNFSQRREFPELSTAWDEIADQCQTLRTFDCLNDRPLAFWIADHKIQTDMMISAPIHLNAYWEKTRERRDELFQSLLNGEFLETDTCVVISTDTGTNRRFSDRDALDTYIEEIRQQYEGRADLQYVNNDHKNYYVLIP